MDPLHHQTWQTKQRQQLRSKFSTATGVVHHDARVMEEQIVTERDQIISFSKASVHPSASLGSGL